MVYETDDVDNRTNSEAMVNLMANLRKRNASRYGLKEGVPRSYLIGGTSMHERRGCLGYNLSGINDNVVLFTGQCLVKDREDKECPVTLEDALECEKLRDLLEKNPVPTVCMYPDSMYKAFIEAWSGKEADDKTIDLATERYIQFRKSMLPGIAHVRTSEIEDRLAGFMKRDMNHIRTGIRRIYGGRVLKEGQEHQLQQTILEYGIKMVALPIIAGHENKSVVVFAEPDEICSVKAAESVAEELGVNVSFALIGQIPLPSIDFPSSGRIRMYSAEREKRIHLNESDESIRKKFGNDINLLLLSLYSSPLTSGSDLEHIGRSKDRLVGIDLMMQQIDRFRSHLQ